MGKTMAERTPAEQEARREQNRAAQAAYRAKHNARGLYQTPVYVNIDGRPEMWNLDRAFKLAPSLIFSSTAGCLRRTEIGKMGTRKDGGRAPRGSMVSPVVVIERGGD